MKKSKVFALLLVIIIFVTISACDPTQTSIDNQQPNVSTGDNEVQNIQVDKTSPQRTIASTEDFPLPNCGGTETLKQTLGTQVSVSKNVQMGTTVSVSGGYEVGVPEVSKTTVRAAIEAAYQQEYETANSRLDTIEMGAALKTHVIYTIEWERQEFSSVVTYELNREIVQTPYTFIMNVPKISGSREEICPTPGLVISSTAIPTSQSNIDPPSSEFIHSTCDWARDWELQSDGSYRWIGLLPGTSGCQNVGQSGELFNRLARGEEITLVVEVGEIPLGLDICSGSYKATEIIPGQTCASGNPDVWPRVSGTLVVVGSTGFLVGTGK